MYSSYKSIFNCHCRPQGCYTLRSKVMHCNVKGATLSFLQSPGTQLQLLQEAAALYLWICICLNTGALLPLRLVSLQLCGAALSPTVSTFHLFTGTVLVHPIKKGFLCTLAWFKKKNFGFEVWSSDMFFGWAKLGFMNFFKFIDP